MRCVCGVLGHLAPVRGCGRSVCCAVYAVSWATWPLFAGVPAGCVVCFVCGVLGHLAPVHRLARSARCVACAVSWATWLRFRGADARCVVLCMPCPGPLGSCSPVCQPGASCCVCGVLGHVAHVHWCARSVCCAVCAVFLATSLLFTGALARRHLLRAGCPGPLGSCSAGCSLGGLCCVLRVRCPWPLGSCSTLRTLCVLHCVCGVPGHLAPVHQFARSAGCVPCAVSSATWLLYTRVLARCVVLSVACAVWPLGSCSPPCAPGVLCCVCGEPLRGAHSSIRTAAFCSGQGQGTLPARKHPSGRRLFRCRQLLGTLPGAHTSIRTATSVAWHLFSCPSSLRVVRAVEVCGTRLPLLLGTCPCAFVVAGGVPLLRASWLRVVCRASARPVAVDAPVCFPDAVVPFPTKGAFTPGFTGRLRRARGGRPRIRLIVPAAGPCRGRGAGLAPCCTRSGAPRWGCPWQAPPALVLGCVRCADLRVWRRSLTRPVFRTIRRWTGETSGAPGLFCMEANTSAFGLEDATPGSHAFSRVHALLGRVGRTGLPRTFWCASSFLWLLSPSALPLSCHFVSLPSFFSGFFFPPSLCAPAVSCLLWFPAPGALGVAAVLPPPPPLFFFCLPAFLADCLVWCLFRPALLFLLPPPLFFSAFCPLACGASPCFVVCFCALCGVLRGGSLNVVQCCWLLPRVVPCLRSCCPAASFALWFAVWFWSAVPCTVLCRGPGCGAAPRCSVWRCAVVCCVGLFLSFAAATCCAVLSSPVRRPGVLCFPALCFVLFPRAVCSLLRVFCRGVLVRVVVCSCALCCVCVLCVSWGVVLCIPCPLCSVRCCAVLCWCVCVVLFVWSWLFLAPGAVVRCCVLCCLLWCSVVRCWLWLPAVALCWRVLVLASLFGRLACFPVVGVVPCSLVLCSVLLSCRVVLCCRALLSFCGAVCACSFFCRVPWCCAALCCRAAGLCCVSSLAACGCGCPFLYEPLLFLSTSTTNMHSLLMICCVRPLVSSPNQIGR